MTNTPYAARISTVSMSWLVILASVGIWLLLGGLWLALDPGRLRVTEKATATEEIAAVEARVNEDTP